MILGFTIEQIMLIICYIILIFNLLRFIKNIKKKATTKPKGGNIPGKIKKKGNGIMKTLFEGMEQQKKTEYTDKKIPEPSNTNIVNNYTGVARRSGEYNNKIFNKLEDQINRLLMKDYGDNYIKILDRFDYLLTLKMLDNTLTVNLDDDKQMLDKVEKINKYGDTKKFIDDMKKMISMEIPEDSITEN